jgi:UDP-GlcNAc:undecaprenyl-phosphate GlcNAc-1-phosphate transferase
MGGIVIYIVLLFFVALFYDLKDIKYLLSGSLLLALTGALDDIKGVKWHHKFLLQSVASVLLIIYFVRHNYLHFNIAGYPLAQEFSIPILFLAIMGILNSFNLLDGLDGLVTGFSLIIASISFLLSFGSDSHLIPLLSIILIGSTLGFLKYTWLLFDVCLIFCCCRSRYKSPY